MFKCYSFHFYFFFVIISRQGGLGFGTFAGNDSGGLPGDLRA